MELSVSKEFKFEASHQLPNHDGKCARLHGHSWVLTVWVSGDPSTKAGHAKEGMVVDFGEVKAKVQPLVDRLDHHHLGNGIHLGALVATDVEGFDVYVPTSENIVVWIAQQLENVLDWSQLDLSETCTARVTLLREDYDERY